MKKRKIGEVIRRNKRRKNKGREKETRTKGSSYKTETTGKKNL